MKKKNSNILFTIIVPTYNNCKSLSKTIARLLSINYENYEIIVVNDGSTDDTKQVAERFQSNGKIILINQENHGVSSARNAGIKMANGDYIIFVDDDDELKKDALKELSSIIKQFGKPDIVRFSGYAQNKDGKKRKIVNKYNGFLYSNEDKKDICRHLFEPGFRMDCYVWLLAVKNNNVIPFNEKMTYLEDEMFYVDNFTKPNVKILIIDKPLYTYKHNSNSKTKNVKNVYKNIDDLMVSKTELQKHKIVYGDISKMISANIFRILFARYHDAKNGHISCRDIRKVRRYLIRTINRNNLKINKYFSRNSIIKYALLKLRLF